MLQEKDITVSLTPELELKQALKGKGIDNPETVTKLTIVGTITFNDFEYMSKNMGKTLQGLDMSSALFERSRISSYFRSTVFHNLISVILPDTVTEISGKIFFHCTSLTSVTIPRSLTGIDKDAFNRRVLFTVHPDNPVYTSKNGKLAFKKIKDVSGRIGKVEWRIFKGVLTISGEGEIPDYNDYGYYEDSCEKGTSPWYPYRKLIKKIVFNGKISLKGIFAFSGFDKISSVTFQNSGCSNIINKVFHGYQYEDLWNIDCWFPEQMSRMIKELKLKTIAYPGGMTAEEWDAILDRMAFCFSEMERLAFNHNKIKRYNEMKNEGLALFCENFDFLGW